MKTKIKKTTDSIQIYQEPLQGVNIFLMFEIFLVYPVGIQVIHSLVFKTKFLVPMDIGIL